MCCPNVQPSLSVVHLSWARAVWGHDCRERGRDAQTFPGTRAPVWVVFGRRDTGNRSWHFCTLPLEEGPYCALYLHCTSTARCMETRAKNTIIFYKYPGPKISWRMSERAELGARGRSTFGKRYFWTACIRILEYLLCKPLWRRTRLLMEGIFTTIRLFHPACLPRAAKRSWLLRLMIALVARSNECPLGFLSPLSRASSGPPVPNWLRTRRIPLFPSVREQADWLCLMSIRASDPLKLPELVFS